MGVSMIESACFYGLSLTYWIAYTRTHPSFDWGMEEEKTRWLMKT